jgi:hypothetical protein
MRPYLTCANQVINTLLRRKRWIFLGQDPGLLGYGFKILGRIVDFFIPIEYRAKFLLSRCKNGRKIGDTYNDFSRVLFFYVFLKQIFWLLTCFRPIWAKTHVKSETITVWCMPPPALTKCNRYKEVVLLWTNRLLSSILISYLKFQKKKK